MHTATRPGAAALPTHHHCPVVAAAGNEVPTEVHADVIHTLAVAADGALEDTMVVQQVHGTPLGSQGLAT
jgi:hypothetical protein